MCLDRPSQATPPPGLAKRTPGGATRLTSVYVHVPWCLRRCPYCDFATQATGVEGIPHARYARAIARELQQRARQLSGRTLQSVFFGGGTPSLWAAEALGETLNRVRRAFAQEAPELEVTVECNPSSLTRAKARALADAGVTRLSVGVQSLDDAYLRYLGRWHSAAEALRALDDAMLEVPRVSADLIFGLPEQPATQTLAHLDKLVGLGVEHLSCYALTIEANTPFGARARRGQLPLAQDDDVARTYLAAEAYLLDCGFEHYEVSNYARHKRARAEHNVHTWRLGDILGLGCAAVGCLAQEPSQGGHAGRYRNLVTPKAYISAIEGGESAEGEREELDAELRWLEALMLGLRTSAGVDLLGVEAALGRALPEAMQAAVQRQLQKGCMQLKEGLLQVPLQHWLRLDGILSAL